MRVVLLLALCACSFRHGTAPARDDAGVGDARPGDAPATRKIDIVSGSGRTQAGSITIDVEVGRSVPDGKTAAGSMTIDSAPAITP
jgi:hypothetical protein